MGSSGYGLSIIFGNASGNFASNIIGEPVATGVSTLSDLQVTDLNGDRFGDLILLFNTANQLQVRLNDQNQDFTSTVNYATGGTGLHKMKLGDVNNDGNTDVVLTNSSSNNVAVFIGDGSGGLSAAVTYTTPLTFPSDVFLSDFNSDGFIDIIAAHGQHFSYFENNGDGTFPATGTQINTSTWSSAPTLCDVNNDGNDDYIYLDWSSNILVVPSNGDGTFGAEFTLFNYGGWSSRLGCVDYDQDSDIDIILDVSGAITLFTNNTGTYTSTHTLSLGNGANKVSSKDINGDTYPEILILFDSSSHLAIVSNEAGILGGSNVFAPTLYRPQMASYGDLNNDGIVDVITGSGSSNRFQIHLAQ